MSSMQPITIAYGDGIGPEIMTTTLRILEHAGARIVPEIIEIGEKIYTSGHSSGIKPEAWESLRRTRVFLKAPITTPQGGGFKSINVTTRKTLGLYANIRPCVSYFPYIHTKHPKMDVVIIRENEEDLYAGIEHRQTTDVVQCLKLISRPGTEKIIRYAFEYAQNYGRKKIACFTKDNIMKETDGLFHKIFNEISEEYADIQTEHYIIDIGCAKLADSPQDFDVIVTSNLYGDIISDVAAQIAGSVGLAGTANIGEGCAMFEAIHGSAPMIAGQDIANPSGLLLAAIQMLIHINQNEIAEKIHNAWLKTIEDGVHTPDIYNEGISTQKVGTQAFGDAVIQRLGKSPEKIPAAAYPTTHSKQKIKSYQYIRPEQKKELVGVDIFVDWKGNNPEILAEKILNFDNPNLKLKMITNRGVKVWPDGYPETFCTDHWRCRFIPQEAQTIEYQHITSLLEQFIHSELGFIKLENLYTFDGVKGYSMGQGE